MRAPRKQKASTRQENVLKKTRHFKGVRKRKGGGKWVSEVRVPNSRERIWLGSYDTPEQAARAYDYAVFCLRGPKAKFNFPDSSLMQNALAPSCSPEEIQDAGAKYALEGFRQASKKDEPFSGNESQTCVEGQLILEKDAAFSGNIESQTCIEEQLILEKDAASSSGDESLRQLILEKDAAISGNESQTCVKRQLILEKDAEFSCNESQTCIEEQLILEKDAAFSGNEFHTCIEGQLILEEEDPALLDSLLQGFETANVNDLSGRHAPPDDSDFLIVPEEEDKI